MAQDANESDQPAHADQREHRVPEALHVAPVIVVALVALWLLTQTAELPLRALVAVGAIVGALSLRWPRRMLVPAGAVIVVFAGSWIGANSPRHTWFGSQVSNGPRDANEVAITFDDGPNDPATLAIAEILDDHGAKGTFFIVGKALVNRPDIVQALLDGGHLVANHSYNHDSTAWLNPAYPELTQTQRAFEREVGVCPAFFRAPHGQHTPFMAYDVHANGMTMVGWDVSAGDWLAKDPKALAARILRKVKPGSIIDLHDSLDGNVHSDTHVLVEAMPYLLDGLEERGLKPVRLDHLLGRDGYLDC
jgi:peptidoglycan/xylan/chitin deacetylase (PgdA/CDA1 family)